MLRQHADASCQWACPASRFHPALLELAHHELSDAESPAKRASRSWRFVRAVQAGLQVFAWTEGQVPSSMRRRQAYASDIGSLGEEAMFCFERALKLLYFSALAYDIKEVQCFSLITLSILAWKSCTSPYLRTTSPRCFALPEVPHLPLAPKHTLALPPTRGRGGGAGGGPLLCPAVVAQDILRLLLHAWKCSAVPGLICTLKTLTRSWELATSLTR